MQIFAVKNNYPVKIKLLNLPVNIESRFGCFEFKLFQIYNILKYSDIITVTLLQFITLIFFLSDIQTRSFF